MKRFIIILSALLIAAAAFSSCNNGKKGEDETTKKPVNIIDESSSNDGSTVSEPESVSSEKETTVRKTYTFNDVNETVYVAVSTGAANIRSDTYVDDSTTVKSVTNGTELKRTGISKEDDGEWSRVEFEGKTCYIKSSLLTTMKDPNEGFTEVSKTLYLKVDSLTVRYLPTSKSEAMGYLANGEKITIIAENTELGWYKIHYKGKYTEEGDYYIAADEKYFTTEEDTTAAKQ